MEIRSADLGGARFSGCRTIVELCSNSLILSIAHANLIHGVGVTARGDEGSPLSDGAIIPMGTDIRAFLAIDDNTPSGEPTFTNDPSYWNFSEDLGLSRGKHYEFYAAIAGMRNHSGIEPLIAPRGLPKHHPSFAVADLYDEYAVGWLTLGEIEAALEHMGIDRNVLGKPVLLVLDVMAAAERRYGKDRVRLIFGFDG
jgi:hypothetical protein